jgi:hypothetical protein
VGFCEVRFGQSGCRAGGDDAVSAGALGLIKSIVGELEEEIGTIGGFIEGSDPDRDGKSIYRLVVAPGAGFLESLANFLGARRRLTERALWQDERELFAAVAAGDVFSAHATQKSFADSG